MIIRFENVSKRYTMRRDRPRSFREAFVGRRQRQAAAALWALREVSFEVQPGESVALIGANGAGKSTALKLISRVIWPNAGRVTVAGRVAALLELGTGFHPDLSGRDNVYLAGALAGLGRGEIDRKYDAIVAFAEIAPFIDMPVKHYSSGMFARLAFAVAIHLEPEVLLVDEVLAVGDHSFQRKCLDRITELQGQGITVCLVSHSAEVVRSLCTRALWFDQGRLRADGAATGVTMEYLRHATEAEAERLAQASAAGADSAPGTEAAPAGAPLLRITGVRLLDAAGQEKFIFETGDPLTLAIDYHAREPVTAPIFGMAIHRHDGVHITGPNTASAGLTLPTLEGRGTVTFQVGALPLLDGLYHASAAIVNHNDSVIYDYHDRRYPFRVVNVSGLVGERHGLLTLNGEWRVAPAAVPQPLVRADPT